MRTWTIFSLLSLLLVCRGQNLEKETCDATRSVVNVQMSGAQAVIGGLFEVRSPTQNGYACGQPHKELIQLYEAARWALQRLNANNVVPGVKLGMTAYDTCGLRSLAIKYAEHFFPQYSSLQSSCSFNSTISLGFLGPLSSWTSKPVAALASSWPASVLSPRASSPALSDKHMYPYFLRTSPSVDDQSRAIIALLNKLLWKRIVVVKTNSEYGNDGYAAFLKRAYNSGICVTKVITVPEYGSATEYKQLLTNIASYDAKVSLFFGSYMNALTLFSALETVGGADAMQYMFTDLNLMEAYSSKFAKGAIFVGPEVTELSEFANYFVNLNELSPPNENPWFKDWYMTHYDCNLGVSYLPYSAKGPCNRLTAAQKQATFRQVPYVTTTVKAVYAYAKALREAHRQKCSSIPGVCNALKVMTTEDFHKNFLKPVNFQFAASDGIASLVGETVRFDSNGDMLSSSFAVFNYNNRNGAFAFEKVGTFIAETLNMDASKIMVYDSFRNTVLSRRPNSTCPASGCGSCLIPRGMVDFYFTPGDVVIGGAISVHLQGMQPFSCGGPYGNSFASAAGFQYGLATAKTALPGILNGVSLGGLVMDVCDSAETGLLFMNNVLGEIHIVRDRKGRLVDQNTIKAFVEVMGSGTTKEFSMGLHPFQMPEIGTIATSIDLGDKAMYPYYTRVVPSDIKQASGISSFLANMGWTYIQTLQSANDYARTGVQTLRNMGKYQSICIAASYEFETDGSYVEILEKLRKNPQARAVVIFSGTADAKKLFQALKTVSWQQDFVLIGADFWGTSKTVISGYEDIANGGITFMPASYGTNGFRNWLNTLNPRQDVDIPWFKEWYQKVYNCYIDAGNKGTYSSECTGSPITSAPGYEEGYGLSYTINAVYAVAKALDQSLTFFCGNGYSGVCSSFRASPFVRKTILQYLQNSTFFTENKLQFEMINGEGNVVYNIYNYRLNGGYTNIGFYDSKSGQITVNKQNIVYPNGVDQTTFSSACSGRCYDCSYVSEKPSYYETPGDIKIGGLFGVHDRNPMNPYACGGMKTANGFQFGSAMVYAIEMVNSKSAPVSLNGLQLGTILLDYCDVESRAFDSLAGFYSGTLPQYFWRKNPFEPENVTAWITDFTGAITEVKQVVSELNLPLLSPAASSEDLSDLDEYPTFFRTVGGDVSLSIAMAELAGTLNFKYVTVVYSDSAYGKGGMNTFESVSQQEGICITQRYKMDGSMTAAQIINAIQTSTSQVVILWTGVSDSLSLLDARRNNPVGSAVVFIFPMPFMAVVEQFGTGGTNTFMLNIKRSDVAGYQSFMQGMYNDGPGENPLLIEYYMTLFKCDLPGYYYYKTPCQMRNGRLIPVTEAPGFAQDNYVIPTINAVYAYVAGLDATLKEKCGMNYNGICSAFATTPNINSLIMKHMESVSFRDPTGSTFQFLNREGNSGLDVFFYNGASTNRVGEFAGASLQLTDKTLQDRFTSTSSTCFEPCTVCIQRTLNFTYIPGDILLGGIFDAHQNDLTPFSCGQLKTFHGFQLLEAFNYAINKVNDKSGQFANILKHVSLGGVGLDACQSTIRTGYLVSNIHSGLTKLTRNGYTVNPDDINAYIAGYSSDSSIYLARILKTLKIPQISYASTSTELMDKDKYPYFLRSIPADDKQSLAMIAFFKKYNINYVQIVYTPTNYGERGAKIFLEKAKENKICVAQSISFPDNRTVTQESANEVIASLLARPMANTVVIFADQDYINEMFRAIARNPVAVGKFKFVGSDSWSNNMDAISGVEYLAEGSITLNLESSDIPDFDLYLSKKTPGNYPNNPWFPEFYERMVDCYLTVPTRTRTVQCPSIPENIVAQRNYVQDPGILHVINSVYAAAIGIDLALKAECGENYTTVCEKYKNNNEKADLLITNILRARFSDPAKKNFEFSDRREGNKGYQLYSITKKMTMTDVGYTYDKIGLFSSDEQLQTVNRYKPSWDGSCERERACSECPSLRNIQTRYMLQPARAQNAATLVHVGSIHNQGSDADFTKCGKLNMWGLLDALAFQYTIEEHFPNTKYHIRGLILDNCYNPIRGDHDLYSLMSTGKLCNTDFTFDSNIDSSTVAAVHATKSVEVVSANRVLAPLRIPIVSSGASSTILGNKEKFPYFARTVPPDDQLGDIIADILKNNDLKYVSALYSHEPYGVSMIDALRRSTKKNDVCVGKYLSVPYPASVEDVKPALQELTQQRGANVIVLLTLETRIVLQAAKELGILNKYLWIGTDTWGDAETIVQGFENEVLGSITVGTRDAHVENFQNYLEKITYTNRKNIPDDWFFEFYQMIHKCRLNDAPVVLTEYNKICDKTERITNESIPKWYYLKNVAAIYAAAKAVDSLANGKCSSKETFPECIADRNNYDALFDQLLNVKWNMHNALRLNPNDIFSLEFNNDRYWNTGYVVYNYVRLENGDYTYKKIGSRMNDTTVFHSDYDNYRPDDWTSKCPSAGLCGCEVTVTLPPRQTGNETDKITEPRNYYFYNKNVEPWEQMYKWPIWAIVVAVLTCIGLLITIFLFVYFLIAYPVKGGTTVLGFMMMIGIMGIYALNFAFFLPASEMTCGGRRFMMGVVYTIVFAALLVKSVDNWRYCDYEYTVRKYKGITNSCTLLMMSLGIVLVELIIPIMWLILVPPGAISKSDSKYHDWMWCNPWEDYDSSLVLSMIFVMFLVLLTAIFSAMAWESDCNYFESRWIFVGCVSTAGCFLVWMIVTTNAGPPYRDPAVGIANFVNATALLIFLAIRKLCLLLYFQKLEGKDMDITHHLPEEDKGLDLYSTVYSNEGYDPDPGNIYIPSDSKLSDTGSGL